MNPYRGFSWVVWDAREIRRRAIADGRKIDYLKMHPKPYKALVKQLEKHNAFPTDYRRGLTLYGLKVVASDGVPENQILCKYRWVTLEGIY